MLRDGGGKAIKILNSIKVDLDDLRKKMNSLNPAIIDSSELKLNEKEKPTLLVKLKELLKQLFETKLFQNNSINTAHLLLVYLEMIMILLQKF